MYPALAVLEALVKAEPPTETLWVGGYGGMEAELVNQAGVSFTEIPAAGIHGVGLRSLPGNIRKVYQGIGASRRILRDFQPDVLFFTGGYLAVPMALAGRRKPSVLFVPDIEPGLAIRTIARFSQRIAVSAEDSRRYFREAERVTLTGYPTRMTLESWSREQALQHFNLSINLPTVLIMGGSKGARSINRALINVLPSLLHDMQIIHLTGQLDWDEIQAVQAGLSEDARARYRSYPYLHQDIGAALMAANLVLSRAGASILGEYPLFGLPAILVPYPHAWRYQQVNAAYLARFKAAQIIQDDELPTRIEPAIRELVGDPLRLQAMSKAMVSLQTPSAAEKIADLLRAMGGPGYREAKSG